jgi:hypothetical protein
MRRSVVRLSAPELVIGACDIWWSDVNFWVRRWSDHLATLINFPTCLTMP